MLGGAIWGRHGARKGTAFIRLACCGNFTPVGINNRPNHTEPKPGAFPGSSLITPIETFKNILRSALGQGLAFGFGDEVEAFTRSLSGDEKYEDIVRNSDV